MVDLLESTNTKVQRATTGALHALAFKNQANKNHIFECNALPTLIFMLRSKDVGIHYDEVDVMLRTLMTIGYFILNGLMKHQTDQLKVQSIVASTKGLFKGRCCSISHEKT